MPRHRAIFSLCIILSVIVPVGLLTGCMMPGPGGGAVSIWIVDEAREITPDSEPLWENEIYSASRQTLRLNAAVNETAAFQIAFRTARPPAGPFAVRISELTGPQGRVSAASCVTLYRGQSVRIERFRSWYPARTGRSTAPEDFIDKLVPWDAPRGGGPLRLNDEQTELVWVDLFIPPTTPPGEYSCRLEIVAEFDNRVVLNCPTQVTVAPVALPAAPSYPLLCRIDPRDLLAEHLHWPRIDPEETRIEFGVPTHQAAERLINQLMELFHRHRTAPILWASFPKYRVTSERGVEIDWTSYDRLASGWLDGSAFENQAGVSHWPIPVSAQYPNAELNGGFQSAHYARLLASYIDECRKHFEERGWVERAFLRLDPPSELNATMIDRLRRGAEIARRGAASLPLVAHLPADSLRGLGWHNAPTIDGVDADIWAPPAQWFEPRAMRRQRGLGKQTWFMPDRPPYSPALAVEAPAADARKIPWQAYRYQADAIWLEHAAEFSAGSRAASVRVLDALIYPGQPHGLIDQALPSIRLKRLRRGMLDLDLLHLLEKNGKPLLASRTAEQIVGYAFTDACEENLLATRPAGWNDDARAMWLARQVLLQELINEFAPSPGGRRRQVANLADWGALITPAARVRAEVRGTRLASPEQIKIYTTIHNGAQRSIEGRWRFPSAPLGWTATDSTRVLVPAQGRAGAVLDVELRGLTYNADGVYPFQLEFDAATAGAFPVSGRLAVATAPLVSKRLAVDGDLSDWALASNNAAGDFLLVRGMGRNGARDPTRLTRAFFCTDGERLYVAIRCDAAEGEQPVWRADNSVPMDGAIPWEQDLVEVILDPQNVHQGSGEYLYCLQIKPSGLLIARKGCLTDPPMSRCEPWESGASTAVRHESRAWIVELSIPLDALGEAARRNRIWGCNVTRLDARRGEYSSWSDARDYTYAPGTLGNLVMLLP